MRKIALTVVLGLIICGGGPSQNALAQTPNSWTVPIRVQIGSNGSDLFLGIRPNATDGFDFGIDTVAAPPPPGTPYAYLALATFPNFLQADYRGSSNATLWSLRIVNTIGATSTVSWNVSQVPSSISALFLVSQRDTVNMLRTNTKTYTGDQSLKISFPTPVSISSRPSGAKPETYGLSSYPNPFAATTMLEINLPVGRGPFTVRIFNLRGQEIRLFRSTPIGPGRITMRWDGLDQRGVPVPSGIYFCRLEAEDLRIERKIFRMR